jgi:hypothetical protein
MPTSCGPRPAALKKVTSAASSSASASIPVTPMMSRFHCLRSRVGVRQWAMSVYRPESSSQQTAKLMRMGHCHQWSAQHCTALTSGLAACLVWPAHTASIARSAVVHARHVRA